MESEEPEKKEIPEENIESKEPKGKKNKKKREKAARKKRQQAINEIEKKKTENEIKKEIDDNNKEKEKEKEKHYDNNKNIIEDNANTTNEKKEEKKEEAKEETKEEKKEETKEETKEEKKEPLKIIETKSNMLLYINSISKFLIEHVQKKDMEDYLGEDTTYGLIGLTNLGNTCFMNSAIQCLSNCEYLTKYFFSKYYKKEINSLSKYSSGGKIANSYSDLLDKLWKQKEKYINPYQFYKTFTSYVKIFGDSSQHDSHEMLIYLLEKLHEDLNRNKSVEKVYIELNEKQDNESDIEASNRWWETHQKRDNSMIMDLFSGQYKSTLRCPFCDKISITYDQFSCLELPLENKCFSGTSYVINEKENKIRKINLIFGEDEKFKDICDKINCQKTYKAILCRNNKMYLASLKEDNNLYKIIKRSHEKKKDLQDRIIFYEYEKNELDNKLLFFVVPRLIIQCTDEASGMIKENEKYLFFPKIFNYSPNDKIQKFYDDLKKYYYKYFKENDSNFSDEKINLKIVNNLTPCTQTKDPCDYCKSAECICCDFKFGKDMTMGELQNTQSKKRSFVMYLDIPNNNFQNEDFNSIKLYDNYLNDEENFELSNELTLENCFNSLLRCEKLDESNEWYCPKCKEHRRGYKQLELFRLPIYLILQLKRFKNQFGFFFNSKNSTFVKFPLEELNLNKYLVGPKNKNFIYDLISVSIHYGASFGGHYTAICKKKDKWYEFDDEDVTQTDKNRIVNSNAYVLIYKLRE